MTRSRGPGGRLVKSGARPREPRPRAPPRRARAPLGPRGGYVTSKSNSGERPRGIIPPKLRERGPMIHSIAHDDSRCGRGGPRAAPARPPDRGAGRRRRCRASYPPQAPPPRPHSPPNSCTRPGAQAREGLSTHHSAAAHELRRPALPMRPRGGRPMAVDAKAASRRALPAGRPRRGRRNGPDYLPDHRPADAGPPQSPLEPGKNGGTNRGPPSAGALARTRQGGRRRSTAVRAGAQGPCDPAGRVKGPFWPRGATGAAVARGLEGVPLACSLATCYSPRRRRVLETNTDSAANWYAVVKTLALLRLIHPRLRGRSYFS